ncbi:aldo-keto reductase [Panaeolus papilionaceus]|nr:aldo-keto reductase [Panaeolus papilionaceus]
MADIASNDLSIKTKIKLRDGNEMPLLGFGTYELEGNEAYQCVTEALEAGYRLVDSAAWYENEHEVGEAILDFCKSSGTSRSDIFYTTKLKLNNGYANVKKAIQCSLEACKLGYIDLYLIHGPLGGPHARKESWRAICDFQKENPGLLRSIGISTFGTRHIQELIDSGMAIPTVHQIDLHPFMTRTDIVAFSRKHGMILQAWGPMVRAMRFGHPHLSSLAQKYNKEEAQILLRYSIQKGFIPLPKSSSTERVIRNTQIFGFELTPEEMNDLDRLDEGLVTDWDPTDCV